VFGKAAHQSRPITGPGPISGEMQPDSPLSGLNHAMRCRSSHVTVRRRRLTVGVETKKHMQTQKSHGPCGLNVGYLIKIEF
jgi:hypothetical protein